MYVVSKVAFSDLPPITLGLVRLLIGLPVLLAFARRLPAWRDRRAAGLGLVLAATLTLQLWGTDLAGAAAGSVVTLTTPVFVAMLAPLLLREATRPRQWAGIALALAGAAVISGGSRGTLLGDLLLLAAALAWAIFTVAGAPRVRRLGALDVTAAASAWAIPFMLPGTVVELAAVRHVHAGWGTLLAVLYLGVLATAVAWWAWYRGVERLPAATASVFFLAQPVVGVALSAIFLATPLTAWFGAGAVLVAVGMLLST
jgi:drug/metabolite transporter (DMT)-like permease